MYKNTNVPFEVTGNNFQTTENGTIVTFQNVYIGLKLNTTLTSVTPTKITGNFTIPADVSTSTLDLVVTTIDGGTTVKTSAFNVNYLPLPTLAAAPLNVTSAYKNSTVTFILLGNYFQPDNTYVRLYLNSSVTPVYAVLTSVTPTRITGSFTIPYDQPSGKYRLDLFTTSGGSVSKLSYFTISPAPRPTISGISPTTIYQNNTFLMTVNGDNFQTGSGTNVSLSYGTNQYFMTLNSVTKKQLNGTFTIPLTATAATGYKLNVTTLDGGGMATPYSFTVMQNPKAVVTAISAGTSTNPAYRNTTVAFTVTGKYFQTQDGAMNVTFWNRTQNQPFNATLYSVTTTQIIGSVFIPSDAPLNTWYVNASSADGKSTVPATTTFIVSPMPKPTFASIIPNSGTAGSTVQFTLNGNYFLPRKGTNVTFENGTTIDAGNGKHHLPDPYHRGLTIPDGDFRQQILGSTSQRLMPEWTNTTDKFTVI